VAVEHVAQVAGADDLRRVALRRVRRPDVEVVAHLRREEPAGEGQEELVELEVLALLDGLGVAEGVGVARVEPLLVQVAGVAEEPDVDLALLARHEQEPCVGDVLKGLPLLLLRLGRARLRRGDEELGHAAIRHPHALVVEPPRLAEQAGRLPGRPQENHTLRGVGRAVLPLTRLRRADHPQRGGSAARRWLLSRARGRSGRQEVSAEADHDPTRPRAVARGERAARGELTERGTARHDLEGRLH
jgi:hypothetical protein